MNIFCYELKKLLNWRTLTLLTILCVLTWFAFLSEFQSGYKSLLSHGIYGSYQTELFQKYGVTLEPEELAAFDIPSQKEALIKKMDNLISNSLVFSENGIHSYEGYHVFTQDESAKDKLGEQYYNTLSTMQGILEEHKEGQTLEEWYDSPLMRYTCLLALENRYVNFNEQLQPLLRTRSDEPIVIKTIEKLMETKNANLIPYFLSNNFSLYAAAIGVAALLAGISIAFCVGMAGVAFLLARFSANIVTMLIKMVPICGLSAVLTFLSLRGDMSYSWLYPNIGRGKVDIPEIWIVCFLLLIGIVLSAVMIYRERHVEVV